VHVDNASIPTDTDKIIIIKIRVTKGLSCVGSAFSRQNFPVPIITVSISFRFIFNYTVLSDKGASDQWLGGQGTFSPALNPLLLDVKTTKTAAYLH
jgi:hypothetical protein